MEVESGWKYGVEEVGGREARRQVRTYALSGRFTAVGCRYIRGTDEEFEARDLSI